MDKNSRYVFFFLVAVFGAPVLAQEAIPTCPENPDHICKTVMPGETVSLSNGLVVTYDGADISGFIGNANNRFIRVRNGDFIMVARVAVTNNSRHDIQVTRSMFTVAMPYDKISASNSGRGNLSGHSRDADELPANPFPDQVPDQDGYFNSAVILHPGDTATGRLAFMLPENYNDGLRLLFAFPDPKANSIRYYVAWDLFGWW